MKTAISIPDPIYYDAELTAKELGIARSQLYTLAIKEFMEHHSKGRITQKLNEIFSKENNTSKLQEIGLDTLREATKNDSW